MTSRIGIMQGRLSPRPPDRLQAFPHRSWRAEFDSAARLGFDAIEWIVEVDRFDDNPLLSSEGRREIRGAIRETGVAVRSVCADYFMVRRLAGDGRAAVAANVELLERLIVEARDVGAERILIPLLETSAVDTAALKSEVVESLRAAAETAAQHAVVLGLEMEIPGVEYHALIERVGHPAVRAYYDVGNSTAAGHDVAVDVRPLLGVLHAVHLKDRRRGGTSVPLGTGDTNFAAFFRVLEASGFTGDLLLQHYFDADPEAAARDALARVRSLLAPAAVNE